MVVGQIDRSFETGFGRYELQRFPINKKETLKAWDAADEYLLRHLAENDLLEENTTLLIINDGFGGLSIPLGRYRPAVMIDSYLSMQSILMNAQKNNIDEMLMTLGNSLELPEQITGEKVDIVLIKLPKSLAMLADQLHRIRPVLDSSTVIVAAGMTKNIHMSTMAMFEKIIGKTKTSHARKKARLVFSDFDDGLTAGENPYPDSFTLPYKLDDIDIEISNHAAVFSQDRLDIGARFFIENLPVSDRYRTIVDLGCGNGILGLMAAIKNPAARLIFTDESYMAVESAISNFVSIFDDTREAEFLQTDCLQGVERDSVSLILCNPPFHQNHAITDNIAWQMFSESRDVLEPDGELWVVANRHLAYHAKLKQIFGHCEVVASNKKFVIYKVTKKSR
ncbi:MAG TPA: methyltransferase domain-containing protein [Gammaproteobacteria bacterium]|nr:methyltransferase domain-containing protein [Gammaproteobacteria bacterium]